MTSKVEGNRKKTGGRVKGTPNKITKELKEMIIGALEEKGGQEYLVQQAEDNPNAFMTLLGKVLPMTISNPDGSNILEGLTVKFVDASTDTDKV